MKVTVERAELLKSLSHVHRVVERRNTIPILANVLIKAGKSGLELKATDLDLEIVETLPAEVKTAGSTTVPAHMIYDIVRKLPEGSQVELAAGSDRGSITVKAGRSRFTLQTLPESDFPDLAAGDLPHKFSLPAADLKRLVDKTQFAISTEETRYYLNGIYLHAVEEKPLKLRAVATDGHRLAQVEIAAPKGASGIPGVIVPRKTVAEIQKLLEDGAEEVGIELSPAKIRFSLGKVQLTSKLIDGTFPDYGRVIPAGNDKTLVVERADFAAAVDRVSTVSSERGRAVKLSLASGKLTLSVTNPDFRQRHRGTRGRVFERSLGYRLQQPLSPRHHVADRGRKGGVEARRSRLADAAARPGCRRRALRPDADAGVSARQKKPASPEPRPALRPAARIRRLQLTNFRSYRAVDLAFGEAPVVFLGENGAGKTNILEAISFLAPGRGLRRATLEDAAASEGDGSWAVSAMVDGALGEVQIGTGIDAPAEDESPTRRSRIAQENIASATQFAEHFRVVWLVPEMDGLFLGPAGERRRFLRPAGARDRCGT